MISSRLSRNWNQKTRDNQRLALKLDFQFFSFFCLCKSSVSEITGSVSLALNDWHKPRNATRQLWGWRPVETTKANTDPATWRKCDIVFIQWHKTPNIYHQAVTQRQQVPTSCFERASWVMWFNVQRRRKRLDCDSANCIFFFFSKETHETLTTRQQVRECVSDDVMQW